MAAGEEAPTKEVTPQRQPWPPPRDGYSGAPGSTRHKRVVIRLNIRSKLFAPETRVEIEQIELIAGAGDRGVQPAHVFAIDHFLGDVALIDEDGVPLAALGLVGGYGVGIFHL